MLRFLVAACGVGVSESVAVTVKLAVPDAVAVPDIAPVEELRDSPAGKLPLVTDQKYGDTPPVACKLAPGYADCATPVGSELVVTLSGVAEMLMLRAAVAVAAVGCSESVTFTVKLIAPVTLPDGVPVIAPVLELRLKPAGKLPPLMLHE